MPDLHISPNDCVFDEVGRVSFTNSDIAASFSDILTNAHNTNANGGCHNNGCGNNGSCNEASFMGDEISFPGDGGTPELVINNPQFAEMMRRIKADNVETDIFVSTFVSG